MYDDWPEQFESYPVGSLEKLEKPLTIEDREQWKTDLEIAFQRGVKFEIKLRGDFLQKIGRKSRKELLGMFERLSVQYNFAMRTWGPSTECVVVYQFFKNGAVSYPDRNDQRGL